MSTTFMQEGNPLPQDPECIARKLILDNRGINPNQLASLLTLCGYEVNGSVAAAIMTEFLPVRENS